MKERLTGAIILVALLVLLVPELLTGPESQPAPPADANGVRLRSYTIDLKNDAANVQPPSAQVPAAVAVGDDPVGQATLEPDSASPPVADVSAPVDDASRVQGRAMGSGADPFAAMPQQQAADATKAGESAAPGAKEDDRPRSAFGPNARSPASSGRSAVAKSDADRSSKAAAADAAPAKAASRPERAASAKPETPKAEPARAGSAGTDGKKGWAVQLGVFGSRENAERLAKQVKRSGFPVLFSETSGKDGKKLYWVRVGPEPDEAGADALKTRLKAAGHRDARVVAYP